MIDVTTILNAIEARSIKKQEKEAINVIRSAVSDMSTHEFCAIPPHHICDEMIESLEDALISFGINNGVIIDSEVLDIVVDRIIVLKYIFKIQTTLREIQSLNSSD